jgi:hypothetical protein
MPAWWILVLINIGLQLAYELIRPKPDLDAPDPSALGDFKFPTIGEGRVIPILWGTCKIAGPMVTWYGDLEVVAVKKWMQTGLFTGQHVTTGYKYYLGLQLVLCSGDIDEVLEIRFDDKIPDTTITTHTGYTKLVIDSPDLYGGTEEDGGVIGTVYVYDGNWTQDPDDYLEDKLGTLPAWRGICYAVFRHVYLGTSPYIKDVAIIVRRCPNSLGLTAGAENISGDANPAAMIYELLTRSPSKNGLGIPVGNIDLDALRTAGATLATEGLGLSMLPDRATPAKDLILNILRHIDAVVYVEPSTGLLTMGLIRDDYVVGSLPILDESNCTVKSFARSSWGEIKNQIRIRYTDRADGFVTKTVQAQDCAAIEATGGEVSTQVLNMSGFSTATNAQKAAARALAGIAYPLASLSISADRSAWSYRPGTVFLLNWSEYGITGLVCRVVKIGSGELVSGQIEFEAMEDAFSIDWAAYTAPGGSSWTDPGTENVGALTDQEALLAPYEAVRLLPAPGGGAQQAVVMAARATSGVTKGFNAIIDSIETRIPFFTPSGTLKSAIDETTTTFIVDMGPDSGLVVSVNDPDYSAGFNVAWLVAAGGLEEFIAFQIVSIDEPNQEITLSVLARGCLDTAPTEFGADVRIWFMSYGNTVLNVDGTGSTSIKFQSYNNAGVYPIGSCPTESVSAISPARRSRVYCPTDVRFNGSSYPANISGELTVSWEHRNRLAEWDYADSGETSDPEADVEYDVIVYGESDTWIHTEAGITGKTWTYLEADEISDSGLGRLNNSLRVVVRTYGDTRAHTALREIEWSFDRI